MSLLGLSYNVRLMPSRIALGHKIQRIRDLPGSKTILIALAWGVVTTLLPALSVDNGYLAGTAVAFIWATGFVFGRTAFFDVLDMQGDRIVGKETIPVLIGPDRSFKLLKSLLVILAVLLPVAGATGILSRLSFLLAVCPLLLMTMVVGQQRGSMLPGIRMEFRVESLFVLSGLMALFWNLLL